VEQLQHDARYLPQQQVRQALDARDKMDSALLEQPACSSFKAAKPLAASAARFDVTGVVAAVCRHEFVVSMQDMHTAECFVYYELIMRSAELHFGPQAAGSMQFFFLDVACKFHKYYER
jgi:Kyakuja-Dileera-Zisupton transposase